MKKILHITLSILSLALLSLLLGFIDAEHKKITCKNLVIDIEYGEAEPLISEEELGRIVYDAFDSLVGKKISDINSVEIEDHISSIKFIESAEVFTTISGTMKIKAWQRNPVLRVINAYDQDYYIDRKGKIIPVKTGKSTRVLVASGEIREKYSDTLDASVPGDSQLLHDLFVLTTYIRNDDFLRAQIEQIYVTGDKEFEMVPKVGRHLIVFGDRTNMESKFNKLKIFYDQGMKKAGWDRYSKINLKYKDQVVCEKK